MRFGAPATQTRPYDMLTEITALQTTVGSSCGAKTTALESKHGASNSPDLDDVSIGLFHAIRASDVASTSS